MAKTESHKALRGMRDILPLEAGEWRGAEETARSVFNLFGYREIRTPALEETGLFVSTIGEDTDIVKKEIFSFKDRGGRDVCLRPEGTAPVIRAYLEAKLDKTSPFQKLYYIGPMFRAERPQAGRARQFHQIGVEAIGSLDPALDAEVIALLVKLIDRIGVKGYEVRLNSLGCASDKKALSRTMRELFSDKRPLLCEDCRVRLKENPLRILDCKVESCRAAIRKSFRSVKFLCDDCVRHFEAVKKYLDTLEIPYVLDPYIVRGLDYYTRTVFEVVHKSLGAQNAIGAGGRYDNLVASLGGPELGACGFALGVERTLMAAAKKAEAPGRPPLDVYIAGLGEEAEVRAFKILDELRDEGIACDMDYEAKSLKAKMRTADKLAVRFVSIIGEDELKKNAAVLRDMAAKEQSEVGLDRLVQEIKKRMG